MKLIIVRLFLIIQILFIKVFFSQSNFNYTFNKINNFYYSGFDCGYQTHNINNTIFTNGSILDSLTGNLYTYVSISDTLGNVLSFKKYGYLPYFRYVITKTIKLNNCIYGIGQAFNPNDTINDLDLLFIKFKSDGDTVFTKILHDTNSVIVSDIIRHNSKEFLLLNDYAKDYQNAEFRNTNFLIIDTLGNITNSIYTGLTLQQPQSLLFNKSKKEYYVLGTYKSQPGSNFYYMTYLNCFDTLFHSKFTKNNLSNGFNDILISSTIIDNSIYATFNTSIPGPNSNVASQIKYAKIRVNNHTVYFNSNNVGPVDPYFLNMGGGNICIDKNFVIYPVSYNAGCAVYFCDTNLTFVCMAKPYYDTLHSFIVSNIEITNSKKILGTGISLPYLFGSNYPGFASINFMTNSYLSFLSENCGYVGVSEVVQNKVIPKVFPNPVNDFLFIEYKSSLATKIEILNSDGKCLKIKSPYNGNKVYTGDLNNGLYFLRVNFDNQKDYVIKFLKKD